MPYAEANLVNGASTSYQISSQSTYAEFSGASSASQSGLSEAYDGDTTTGSFARIRTYPCENFNNGPTCTSGAHGQVDYTIQTFANSAISFTIDFTHQMVAYCSTSPKVTFSIWNQQSASWTQMTMETSTGGYTVNQTYSSSYMGPGGDITIRWRAESGCSSTGSNDYIISRLYEFQVFAPDQDGDGVPDSADDCASGFTGWTSTSATDYDSDGCRDSDEDTDDDNDGILDTSDNCQTGHLGWTSDAENDYDIDGCHDTIEDDDDDNDGILDQSDSCQLGFSFTSDSTTDYDGDGCHDDVEDDDDDNDGVQDNSDDCSEGVMGWTSSPANDNDGDGCRDTDEDDDDDNDGFSDTVEADCLSDPLDASSTPSNNDGTGDCDALDDDDDDDGVPDTEDDFPFDPQEDTDTDGDGIGNNADLDDDWDNVSDSEEIECGSDPLNGSSIPENFDGDELCDELDPDDDNDEYNDTVDAFPKNAIEWADADGDGTGDNADTDDDNDGKSDTYEVSCGTNPNDNTSIPQDTDGDEQCNALDDDDDGDGWTDDLEADCGTNSDSSTSIPPDLDGDWICDRLDTDTDGDGWDDYIEENCSSLTNNNQSIPLESCAFLNPPNGDESEGNNTQNSTTNSSNETGNNSDSALNSTSNECDPKPGYFKLLWIWAFSDSSNECYTTSQESFDEWNDVAMPFLIIGALTFFGIDKLLGGALILFILRLFPNRDRTKLKREISQEFDNFVDEHNAIVAFADPDNEEKTMKDIESELHDIGLKMKIKIDDEAETWDQGSRDELIKHVDDEIVRVTKKFSRLASDDPNPRREFFIPFPDNNTEEEWQNKLRGIWGLKKWEDTALIEAGWTEEQLTWIREEE